MKGKGDDPNGTPDIVKDGGKAGVINLAVAVLAVVVLIACCFDGDTPVVMADGSTKPLDQIRVGEFVLSLNPVSGKIEPREVLASSATSYSGPRTSLLFPSDEQITCTENHPFVVEGGTVLAASKLTRSTKLTATSLRCVLLRTVIQRLKKPAGTVYNLSVSGFHNYFIGRQAVLVRDMTTPLSSTEY